MKKREFHNGEDEKLVAAYERGEFKPVKNQKAAKRTAVRAARSYTGSLHKSEIFVR